MPPRKEPKETVVYPASKRKAPPFKPLRPSKLGRSTTVESDASSSAAKPIVKPVARTPAARPRQIVKTPLVKPQQVQVESITLQDTDDDSEKDDVEDDFARLIRDDDGHDGDDKELSRGRFVGNIDDSDDESLDENPLAVKTSKNRAQPDLASQQRAPNRQTSPMSLSDGPASSDNDTGGRFRSSPLPDSLLNQPVPTMIPQALLVRLLHESFEDKSTQIDKQAIQVLQRYIEIFIRETIERSRLEKREACERGEVSDVDRDWLDLEDLEKAAPAMLLDF